jgi:hypothetical protein
MAALTGRPVDGATLEAALKAVQEDVQMAPNAPGEQQALLVSCDSGSWKRNLLSALGLPSRVSAGPHGAPCLAAPTVPGGP